MSKVARHRLITIAWSHYNEQARWALDRFHVDYRERGYLPILHFLPVMLATLGRGVGHADSVSSRFSTPVLITDTGRRIADSREIMRYVSDRFGNAGNQLYSDPEVETLQNHFHDRLGPATRRIVYHYLLSHPAISDELVKKTVSYPQWFVSKVFGTSASKLIVRKLNVTEATVAKALDQVRRDFEQMSRRLQSRRYLVGDHLSAADIAFACLACPALWIDRSDGHSMIPKLEAPLPEALASLRRELRATPAGQFVLRLFQEERKSPSSVV